MSFHYYIEDDDKKMNYLYIHKKVRNDDHCPACRKHYISVHKNMDAALRRLECDFSTNHSDYLGNDAKIDLMNGIPMWVDEWVRRSNGDKYQVCKLFNEELYNLDILDSNVEIDEKEQLENKYMILRVDIDKRESCPDNIKLEISFYNCLERVHETLKSFLDYDDLDNTHIPLMERLSEDNSIWMSKDDESGTYYRIIEIKKDELIYLNDLCEHIDPETW